MIVYYVYIGLIKKYIFTYFNMISQNYIYIYIVGLYMTIKYNNSQKHDAKYVFVCLYY